MNITNLICHRKPERSFHINGYQFPVCARCTGFYIGMFLYFIYVYFFFVDYDFELLLFSFFLLIPSAIDGLSQFGGNRESNNVLRLITGLMGGLGLGIIIKALKYFIYLQLGGF